MEIQPSTIKIILYVVAGVFSIALLNNIIALYRLSNILSDSNLGMFGFVAQAVVQPKIDNLKTEIFLDCIAIFTCLGLSLIHI